jgi:hypothetical protein
MTAVSENSFIARLAVLNPNDMDPAALDVIAKLMEGDLEAAAADCAAPGVLLIARLLRELVYVPVPVCMPVVPTRVGGRCVCWGEGGGGDV